MLKIYLNDEGGLEELSATGTLVDMAAGISTAVTFANVVLSDASPQAARDFHDMILRCVQSPDMWDAERMRPHVNKSVCALNLVFPAENEKGDGQNGNGI